LRGSDYLRLGALTAEDPDALRATMMIFGGFAFRFGR